MGNFLSIGSVVKTRCAILYARGETCTGCKEPLENLDGTFDRCPFKGCNGAICENCLPIFRRCPSCDKKFPCRLSYNADSLSMLHREYHSPEDALVHMAYIIGTADYTLSIPRKDSKIRDDLIECHSKLKAATRYLDGSMPSDDDIKISDYLASRSRRKDLQKLIEKNITELVSLMPLESNHVHIMDVEAIAEIGRERSWLLNNVNPLLVSQGAYISVKSFAGHRVGEKGCKSISIEFHGIFKELDINGNAIVVIGSGDATVIVKTLEDVDILHCVAQVPLNTAPKTCIRIFEKNY